MPGCALVLTVGTGNEKDVEGSILTPFRKSLREGEWETIVLLPSQTTIPLAERVREDNADLRDRIRIEPLPGTRDEYDLDRAFAYFEGILAKLIEAGYVPGSITVDLTRGTKAMSAALALAAVSLGIDRIRYIEGFAKDHLGMTIAGTEKVSSVRAETVSRARSLTLAESFLRQGQFAAARLTIESDPGLRGHPRYGTRAQWITWGAAFWGSWDGFDYPAAEECLARLSKHVEVPSSLADVIPSEEQCELLSTLGLDNPQSVEAHVPLCRALGADLLANARRRFAQGQNEETLVRIARVLELIGQLRLFLQGLDSSAISIEDPRVKPWYEKQMRGGRSFDRRGEGTIVLPRQRAGSLLKHLKDPLAGKLNKYDWLPGFDAELRNHSVLIHGYVARSRGLAGKIESWLCAVEDFYRSEDQGNAGMLEAARFRFFPNS